MEKCLPTKEDFIKQQSNQSTLNVAFLNHTYLLECLGQSSLQNESRLNLGNLELGQAPATMKPRRWFDLKVAMQKWYQPIASENLILPNNCDNIPRPSPPPTEPEEQKTDDRMMGNHSATEIT